VRKLEEVSRGLRREAAALQVSSVISEVTGLSDAVESILKYVECISSSKGNCVQTGSSTLCATGCGGTYYMKEEGSLKVWKVGTNAIHVPCWTHRTMHSAVRFIGESLKISIPRRGFSSEEILEIIYDYLKDNGIYIVIVLDDVFHVVNNSGADALGTLIRFYDEHIGEHDYHFSLILIDRDDSLLVKLDAGAKSTLGNNIIRFPPYTKDQIYEILRDRAQAALMPGTYNDEVLEMIADVTGASGGNEGRGNAKQAIEILWKSALTAQQRGSRRILPEHVRYAVKNTLVIHVG